MDVRLAVAALIPRRSGRQYSSRRPAAFTLIEILVVVSITALLVAILIPSLSRARQQAMLATDKANCKQIGMATATYQSASRGRVPVMFNNFTVIDYNFPWGSQLPRNTLLSVALRDQSPATAKLSKRLSSTGQPFDPNTPWTQQMYEEFEEGIMPEHFNCPFARGKRTNFTEMGNSQVQGRNFTLYEISGRHDNYHPCAWEGRVVRHKKVKSLLVPSGEYIPPDDPSIDTTTQDVDGRPKYSVLSWNYAKLKSLAYDTPPGFRADDDPSLVNRHREWTASDAQRQGAASLSEVTVLFCAQGEHLGTRYQLRNLGSHRSGKFGGTNAVFADTHVEWVKGSQIGWQ